ncbi:tryptophan--tRNA ligase [Fructilactobacillus florum]|nr:tryptophan--tRNA ligase [Fructilactobacillus florum]
MEKKPVMLSGDRPTGRMHIGHYVGSLANRVRLQNEGKYQPYVMIADMQALTDNARDPEKIRNSLFQVALDYLAVGIDPAKSTIFVQSQIPALNELTMIYMNLVTVARLERNPTVKHEIQQKRFNESVPAGFLTYPVSQAADITAFKAAVIPVGDDQEPMIEQTRELVRSFNHIYDSKVLVEPTGYFPPQGQGRIPGLDGNAKMSKSLNNAIYLADDEDTIQKKVMSMYTDPNHIHVQDPGQVAGNTVFTYLDIFADDSSYVAELKAQYQHGGLGDVKIKRYLNEVLQAKLAPIRERRAVFAADLEQVSKILETGSAASNETAEATLQQVRDAMGINYFQSAGRR